MSQSQPSSAANSNQASLPPSYFEQMYAANIDPWDFETSEYEAKKYAATLAALPQKKYRSALEIGGSIGVLTEKLGDRTESLLSVDVSETAQHRAKERCQHLKHIKFEIMQFPHHFPSQTFDLVIVSEVGYYWSTTDLPIAQQQIATQLEPGGHLLLVHWTPYVASYPLTGDQVHNAFLAQAGVYWRSLVSQREERYRLNLLERL
ncbi:MAG: SAM-dependent methyltransferase [Phormidesmis sp.]